MAGSAGENEAGEGVGGGGTGLNRWSGKASLWCLNITGPKAVGEEHLAAGRVGAKALGQDPAGLLEACVDGAGEPGREGGGGAGPASPVGWGCPQASAPGRRPPWRAVGRTGPDWGAQGRPLVASAVGVRAGAAYQGWGDRAAPGG